MRRAISSAFICTRLDINEISSFISGLRTAAVRIQGAISVPFIRTRLVINGIPSLVSSLKAAAYVCEEPFQCLLYVQGWILVEFLA